MESNIFLLLPKHAGTLFHVIVFKVYLVVSRWLVCLLGYVSMSVPDDGFIKRLKHLALFGQ